MGVLVIPKSVQQKVTDRKRTNEVCTMSHHETQYRPKKQVAIFDKDQGNSSKATTTFQ